MDSRSTVPFDDPTNGQPDLSASTTPEAGACIQQGSGRSPRALLATEDPNYRPPGGFWYE